MRVQRSATVLAVAAFAVLGLTACSSGSSQSGSMSGTDSSSSSPSAAMSAPAMTADPAADLVGTGCAAYAKAVPSGAGSISGMSTLQLTDAAAANPLLTTLVKAVAGQLNSQVNLVSTLNGGQFTVFAPVDDAFAKLPASTVDTLKTPAGAATLKDVLSYHVLSGQIAPDQIAGTHTTVEGKSLTVTGSGDSLKVNNANVICGGVHTANATVYLIDSVLTPPGS